jgi:hypothetical protein
MSNAARRVRQVEHAGVPFSLIEGTPVLRLTMPYGNSCQFRFLCRSWMQLVMRDILSPYRKEDVDEVMDIVKANGGLEEMHLAFYADKDRPQKGEPWHFWRLEGPGFVWNYRVIPHVHCFVNIAKIA